MYASQCAYWPKHLARGVDSLEQEIQEDESSGSESDGELSPVEEDDEEEEHKPEGEPDQSMDSNTSSETLTDSHPHTTTTKPDTPSTPNTTGILYLPVLPLEIPSIATFSIVHTTLHQPSRPLISLLLDSTPEQAREKVEKLSPAELMAVLEKVHGVWQNACTLGIGEDRIWKGMGEVWGLVVGSLAGRAARQGFEPTLERVGPRSKGK